MNPNLQNNANLLISEDDSINLNFFYGRIIRNKYLIGIITLTTIILSIIIHQNTKKTWEGQFQIVLSNEKSQTSKLPEEIANMGVLNSNDISSKLKTQVGILESPSVLMPIFEFVNSEKNKLKTNKDELIFYDWKEDLKINLKKNTSILDISYKDKNKDIILPVLERISKAFQKYSGKNKLRTLQITKDYLVKQIEIYKNKSAQSIKDAQEFAMSQDLLFEDLIGDSNFIQNNSLRSNTSIERIRVEVANEIRNLKEQLKKVNELKDHEKLQYIGSTIPALLSEGLPQKLAEIENKLARLKLKFRDTDKKIKLLREEKDLNINLLRNRTIGMLEAKIIAAETKLKSVIRPEGVILEYKKLMREAQRDESTLVSLENQLRRTKLEEAKYQDPWELITIPTLLDDPVAPRLRNHGLIGFFSGIILGISIAIYKEKKSGLVYEEKIIEDYFSCQTIIKLNLAGNLLTNQLDIDLLNEIISNSKKVSFIETMDINSNDINTIKNALKNDLVNKENIQFINKNFKSLDKASTNILLIKMNSIKLEYLKLIKNKLNFSNLEVNAILILEDK
tara:strand:+ start:34 stop:1728 length:1695 start_codon:yes stop_codon:yes gene_type:complete